MRPRHALAAVLASLALGFALWFWPTEPPPEPRSGRDAPPPAAAAAQATAAAGGAAPAAAPGRGSTYELDYAFSMTAPFGRAADEELRLHLRGTLELAAPRSDGEGAWLPARLRDPVLQQNAVAARVLDLPEAQAAAELAAPFAVRVGRDGRVQEVRLDPARAFAARSILAATAFATQRAQAPRADAGAWQAQERDANGGYEAHYRRGDGGVLDKTWTVGQGDDPPARLAQVASNRVRFEVQGDALRALDYHQRGRAATTGLDVATFKPFEVRLRLRRAGASDGVWAAEVQPERLVAFSAASARQREVAATPRSYDAIVADAAAGAGTHAGLRAEWTRRLALDDEALARTERSLRAGEWRGETRQLATEAIVGARTPAAQHRVAAMIADVGLAEALRAELLAAAALMSRPTPAFVTTLERVAFDPGQGRIGRLAATTLGAAAAFLGETDREAAAAVVRRMVGSAHPVLQPPAHVEPPPLAVRLAWLAGLGNTGDPQALPLVLAALHDGNEMVRAQAALALRRQPPAACLDAMVEHMATETSVHVRENLVDAARMMGPDKLQAFVYKALLFDRSEHVRLAAAYAMAVWSTQAPGLRKVLAEALGREKSPKVAEALQNYLTQGRLAGMPAKAPVSMGTTGAAP